MVVKAVEVKHIAVAPSTAGADDGVRIGVRTGEAGGLQLGREHDGVEVGAGGATSAAGGAGGISEGLRVDGTSGRGFPFSEEGCCFLGLGATRDVT